MSTTTLNCPAAHWIRLGGLAYLAIIGLGFFGEVLARGSLVVAGDAAATAAGIAASTPLWRASITADLLMQMLDLPLILLFYLLLRPVHHGLALLATAFNLIQTAVLVLNKLCLVAPLILLNEAGSLAALLPLAQRQGLAMLAIQLHGHGFAIGLLFFGIASLLRAPLIIKSGYLPAWLGWGLGLAGLCYLINSYALLLAPALADALFPGVLLPVLVGESALALWLLFKGIDRARWPTIPSKPQ